jgi:NAD(P)-dependent dehydrogenase (short-subunit alcohol dehydrogenase family)
MELDNKTILITGAGRGLGRALAGVLAKKGATVVLVARTASEVEEVAARIRSEGGRAHAFAADVGDFGAAHEIAGTAAALAGPIDVLVHNASTLGVTPLPRLADDGVENLRRVFDVNFLGPYAITRALIGSMILRGRGLVMLLSSDAAIEAYPGWGAYGASKAALDQLARVWAQELAASDVRFLSVDPGEMDTKMHADAMPDADPSTLADPNSVAETIARMISATDGIKSGSRLVAARWEAGS